MIRNKRCKYVAYTLALYKLQEQPCQHTCAGCDMLVCLPQAGHVESLNVAQATTALAYEWMRQCNAAKS